MAATARRQASVDLTCRSKRAAHPLGLHVRRPNLRLDDLLRFVIEPLHVTLGGLIGGLRRFQGSSSARYLLFPAAKIGRLVVMLSCAQNFGGHAHLLTRAPGFCHGGMHPRLQVAHQIDASILLTSGRVALLAYMRA
jgi:hypothetical protein